MATFRMAYNDSELSQRIAALSPPQVRALRSKYTQADLTNFFAQLREEIANMVTIRVKSKVVTTFTGGYGGTKIGRKPLVDTIYSYFDDDGSIVVTSSDPVMTILNAGFASFDMKERLMGKVVPLRLPGGRIIWRKVGDQDRMRVDNLIVGPIRNTRYLTKKRSIRQYYSSKNWIHPGYQGKHIFEQVARELEPVIKEHVWERVTALLDTLDVNPYTRSKDGYARYNYRSNGRFATFNVIGSAVNDQI